MRASEPSLLRPRRHPALAAWAAACLLALSLPAAVQAQANTREQEQLRRLRQQLQQAQQELGEAQAQAQAAQAKQKAAEQQLTQAQAQRAASARPRAPAAVPAAQLQALQQQLEEEKRLRQTAQEEQQRLRDTLSQAQTRQTQTQDALRRSAGELEDERNQLRQVRAEAQNGQSLLATCRQHNTALLDIGEELIGRHGRFGFGESAAVREPFLQFKRVELENLAQTYRAKLSAQRVRPATAATATATAP